MSSLAVLNLIESKLTLNRIVFFSGESLITDVHMPDRSNYPVHRRRLDSITGTDASKKIPMGLTFDISQPNSHKNGVMPTNPLLL